MSMPVMSTRVPAPVALALGTVLAAAASAPASAGPIFEPGARVIVSASVDNCPGQGGCPNTLIGDRVVAEADVGVSIAERGQGFARARADLVTGTLKARSGALGLVPTGGAPPDTNARAEAAFMEVAQIVGPAGGPGAGDTIGLSFTTTGTVVAAGIHYVSFGFWMRDASIPRVDPNNPDAPVVYLLRYGGEVRAGVPLRYFDTTLAGVDASFDVPDPTNQDGSITFSLSGAIRAAALGPDPEIEFGAFLYTYVEPNALADFGNTARLTLSLPEGYRLVSPSGFLSGAGAPPGGGPPTAVPAPGGLGLLAVGLFGLAAALRARRRA